MNKLLSMIIKIAIKNKKDMLGFCPNCKTPLTNEDLIIEDDNEHISIKCKRCGFSTWSYFS